MNKDKEEQLNWYILIDGEPRGPLSVRDLDVLLRTNEITSRVLGCNAGSKQWRPLSEIEDLKDSFLQSSKEMVEIGQKIHQNKQQITQKKQQNKQENNETMQFLNTAVEGLMASQIFKSEDGKWNLYDEENQKWVVQSEQPTQKIETLRANLLEQLKSELFKAEGWQQDKKHSHMKQFVENLTKEEQERKQKNKRKSKKNAQKKKQKWYNPKINTFVYINGLPPDTTEEQVKQFASKAGIIRIDPETNKEKIKLYRDQNGIPKGDAVISYAKQQSIGIALDMLSDREFKPGHIVKLERAHFNQKSNQYVPRQSKKQNKVDKVLAKKKLNEQFDWKQGDEVEGEGFKIVILKYVFVQADVQNQETFAQTKEDIKQELQKIGAIVRIRFFDAHPDGIVEVKFKEEKDAEECINVMNGRFYDGRQIQCFYWDGETDYKLNHESKEVEQKRIQQFGKWLQEDDRQQIKEQQGEEEEVKEIQLTLEDLQDL